MESHFFNLVPYMMMGSIQAAAFINMRALSIWHNFELINPPLTTGSEGKYSERVLAVVVTWRRPKH